jgi:hypothetical protein
MVYPSLASGAISSQASLCGGKSGGILENDDPAEPDDPNSSSLNPNEHKKRGMGKHISSQGNGFLPIHLSPMGARSWGKGVLRRNRSVRFRVVIFG